ncbi:hypothetical protein PYCC9005_005589 [Savitreella phatthalungensis]
MRLSSFSFPFLHPQLVSLLENAFDARDEAIRPMTVARERQDDRHTDEQLAPPVPLEMHEEPTVELGRPVSAQFGPPQPISPLSIAPWNLTTSERGTPAIELGRTRAPSLSGRDLSESYVFETSSQLRGRRSGSRRPTFLLTQDVLLEDEPAPAQILPLLEEEEDFELGITPLNPDVTPPGSRRFGSQRAARDRLRPASGADRGDSYLEESEIRRLNSPKAIDTSMRLEAQRFLK